MFQILWPFAFLLLPVPFLIRAMTRLKSQTEPEALWVPFFASFKQSIQSQGRFSRVSVPILFLIGWCFLALAAARPQYVGEIQFLPAETRNLMLVLDVSDSMAEQDFDVNGKPTTRLYMVKTLADDFLKQRKGDQVGLVLFAQEAYQYVPLTPDVQSAQEMLKEVDFGIAGSRTAMGDALAMALKNMKDVPAFSKVVVLMSDGYANAGQLTPDKALEIAKEMGVKVYTIGIGGDVRQVASFFGQRLINPSADLDETTLKKLATETGGLYFRAKTTPELARIYQKLDELEPVETNAQTIRPVKELFYGPLGIAMALFALGLWMKERSS